MDLAMLGTVVVVVMTCITGESHSDINNGLCILASLLAIIFVFLNIHGAGVTDIAPLTASAKGPSARMASGPGLSIKTARALNLIADDIVYGVADMT
jgi:hypothetical protein